MILLKNSLLGFIHFYQTFLSSAFPPRCRFYPSCSSYAAQAIEKYGLTKGLYQFLRRLLRCHPWHPGGYDPLP